MNSSNFAHSLIIVCAILALSACATTTNVDYRQGYDFNRIHRIQIGATPAATSSDTRINSPLVDQRIRAAVAAYLAARGYQLVDSHADTTLVYQLTTRSGLESRSSGVSFGFGTFGPHSAVGLGYGFPLYDIDSYDEAVLTIDLHDNKDNSLLWRGSAYSRLGDGNTPEKLTDMVNGLVAGILDHFPPGRKR
jgi:Domain of unknown function (DUF4136)